MPTLEKRVSIVETVLAEFMRESSRILAAVHEEVAEIRLSNARTDRRLLEIQQQADKDREQADKDRQDFNRRMAILTDQQGLMIENMVWPNLPRIAAEVFGGEPVLFSGIRLKRKRVDRTGENMEVDLMAVSPKQVLICEAKSKVDADKARDFLARLAELPAFFPEYAGYEVLPMMASIAFDPSALKSLTKRGIYALGFGGETMELLNPEARR